MIATRFHKHRPPRVALAAAALVLLALTLGAPVPAQPDRRTPERAGGRSAAAPVLAPHSPGEVLLRFADAATPAERSAILAGLGAGALKRLGAGRGGVVRLGGLSVEEALATFGHDPRVAYIEPNYILSAQATPDDPDFGLQWNMYNSGQSGGTVRADIHAREAWDVFTGSHDTLVAVIDSGIDLTHPDLVPNIAVNPGEIADNGLDDDGNGFVDDTLGWNFVERSNDPTDDNGHGTHVAGILGAVGNNGLGVAGTCWRVKLLPVRFLNAGGFGATAQAVESIDYAVAMDARIINASWGNASFSVALREAIMRARDAGVLLVTGAGNGIVPLDLDVHPFYPGSYDVDNIITVAASDRNDVVWQYSNYGDESVDLAAPGVEIFSTLPGGVYGFLNGTSMAAPHVSGALALLLGRFPELSVIDARSLLVQRADVRPTLAGAVIDGRRLNALGPIAVPDDTPPAAIDTLSVVEIDGGRAELEWIAAGDDGDAGRANRYDLRYSAAPIDAPGFAAATRVIEGVPEPAPAGALEHVRVEGLQFETTYYFAVKAVDELGNASPISNVASATTPAPPVVGVDPLALTDTLAAGDIRDHVVGIENHGAAEYIFDVVLRRPQSGPQLPRVAEAGTDGLRVLILGSGALGPDIMDELSAFPSLATVDLFDATSFTPPLDELLQYQAVIVVVNLQNGNPGGVGDVLADYVDAGGGVVLTLASFVEGWQMEGRFRQEGYYPFELGQVSSDSADLGEYDDTHPIMLGVSEAVAYQLAAVEPASGAEVVASWSNGQPFVVTRNGIVGINVSVLHNYSWSGDIPLVLVNAAYWASGAVSWISTQPEHGIVAPGQRLELGVRFDTTRLIAGRYQAEVALRGNDPQRPDVAVAVDVQVTGTPAIEVSSDTLDAGEIFVGTSVEVPVVVTNRGTDTLIVSGVATDRPDFAVEGSGFVLEARHSRTLAVVFSPAAPGTVEGTLLVDSDDPAAPRTEIRLVGRGLGPPAIAVLPAGFAVDLDAGQRERVALQVDNPGAADLQYELRLERAEATYTFEENFEDGDLGGWHNAGTTTGAVTEDVAAAGTHFSYHESFADFGHLNGIYRQLGGARPGYAGVHVRSGSTDVSDAFFVLRDDQLRDVIWFYARIGGTFYVNADVGGHAAFPYQAETWYHVEFRNIDFQLKRFDYWIDGVLIQARVPFRSPADNVDRLDLYAFNSGARSWWDEIFISSHPPVDTVALDRAVGSLAAGGTTALPITLDATGVIAGEYGTRLVIDTNVPSTPRVEVPIVLAVTGFPRIELAPGSLNFGAPLVGQVSTRTLAVSNAGTGDLHVARTAVDHADFTVDADGFVLAPGAGRELRVTYRPSAPGPVAASLTIDSDDGARPSSVVPLAGEGLLAPRVDVAPGEIREALGAGESATRPLTLTNAGGGSLSFEVALTDAGGAPVQPALVAFADDGAPGVAGWTTEVYGGGDLWHRTPATAGAPDTAWWCGIEGQAGYDTGERVGTALVSPPIDLRGLASPAVVQFSESFETEPGYDNCMVDVSADGGRTWIPLRGAYGAAPSGSSGGWRLVSLSLSPYAGRIVRLRFYFETQDGANNHGAGWFVDDVRVRGGAEAWLRADPTAGTLGGGQSAEIALTLGAAPPRPPGRYEGSVVVRSNDLASPEVRVPVTLDVAGSPRIALAGEAVTLESGADFDAAVATLHRLVLDSPPGGAGELRLSATGGFGEPGRTATLSAEAAVLGVAGGAGAGGCGTTVVSYPLPGGLLAGLAADGAIDMDVRNSPAVGSDCPVNRHALRLTYPAALERLDLGTLSPGEAVSRTLTVANTGDAALDVLSVTGDLPGLVAQPAAFQVPPGGSAEVEVRFSAAAAGPLAGSIAWISNDPARPALDLPVVGEVLAPAVATVAPEALVATLPPRSTRTRTKILRLANAGLVALDWSAAAVDHALVEPAAGTVESGQQAELRVVFSAAGLDPADYASTLSILANTVEGGLEIPLLLHVREVELERLNVDFSPRFSTTGDTVEVAIELPPSYAPEEILVDSVLLNDCAAAAPAPVSLADLDLNGIRELIVQFDAAAFEECMPRADASGIRSVTVVGEVEDRSWFTGTRYLRGIVQLP